MRVVLLGDSHLARIRRDLHRIGDGVVNAAVGGAFASDLLPQAAAVGLEPGDVVVVSVGTNDAAPWKSVPLAEFGSALEEFVRALTVAGLVYVVPPGVDESRLEGAGDQTVSALRAYADRASSVFTAAGATLVDAWALLEPLGPAAFTDDGIHLTGAAYDALLPAIRDVLPRTAGHPAT